MYTGGTGTTQVGTATHLTKDGRDGGLQPAGNSVDGSVRTAVVPHNTQRAGNGIVNNLDRYNEMLGYCESSINGDGGTDRLNTTWGSGSKWCWFPVNPPS